MKRPMQSQALRQKNSYCIVRCKTNTIPGVDRSLQQEVQKFDRLIAFPSRLITQQKAIRIQNLIIYIRPWLHQQFLG